MKNTLLLKKVSIISFFMCAFSLPIHAASLTTFKIDCDLNEPVYPPDSTVPGKKIGSLVGESRFDLEDLKKKHQIRLIESRVLKLELPEVFIADERTTRSITLAAPNAPFLQLPTLLHAEYANIDVGLPGDAFGEIITKEDQEKWCPSEPKNSNMVITTKISWKANQSIRNPLDQDFFTAKGSVGFKAVVGQCDLGHVVHGGHPIGYWFPVSCKVSRIK